MAFSWSSTPAPKTNNNNGGSSGFGGWGSSSNNNNNQNSNNNNQSNVPSSPWGAASTAGNTSTFGNTTQTEGGGGWGNNNNTQNTPAPNNNSSSFGGFGATPSSNNTNSNTASSPWGNTNNTNNNTPATNNNNVNNNNNSSASGQEINPNKDYILNDPPSDAISSVHFHPNQARFVVGSWDNSVGIYEFFGNNQSKKLGQQTHDRPVLDCCFSADGDSVFSAGCDNLVRKWSPQQNQWAVIGKHQAPVRCVVHCSVNGNDIAVSGSWDQTIAIWDCRTSGGAEPKPVFSQSVGSKVYAMAQRGSMLVVASSDTDIKTFDLRQNGKLVHSIKEEEASNKNIKAVSLKKQIRALDIWPDENGYVAASIGGRVIIKHFNRGKAAKDFSYKCHRHGAPNDKWSSHVFAVNVVRFHKPSGVFATGGDDGEIVTWDMKGRSKLHNFKPLQIPNYQPPSGNTSTQVDGSRMPIVALDYHSNGQYMLYATSYNWNKGQEFNDRQQQRPQMYLHQTQANEFAVKKK